MDESNCNGSRKPLIAKLRAGVKVQNTISAANIQETLGKYLYKINKY